MGPAEELPAPLPPPRPPRPPAPADASPATLPAPTEPAASATVAPAADVSAAPAVRVVDLDWRSVATVLAAFVALVTLSALIGSTRRTSAALAVAVILALALNPLVALVRRRLPIGRANAVAVVVALAASAAVLLGLLLVPPALRQARDLGAELPSVVAELGDLPVVGDDLEKAGVPERFERAVRDLPERLAGDTTPLQRAARSAADGMLAAAVTVLFALTLLVDGERLLFGARRLVPPSYRPQAERTAAVAYEVVGRYVAGSLLVAAVAGIAVLVIGLVLGVPLTPLAAAWVALWDLVPQVGGAAGGIPFVLLAFTQGAGTGLACAGFFVVYLQIENNVLGPLLVGQAVKLSPLATMTAALVGVSAGGVVGALLAVPLVGAAKAVYLEVRVPPRPAGGAERV
ncbi:MAG TPA: AI-2E family transporter [Acidimicrobiales bacterium]|nr:AI-2E family transporter [Acidimicrobiales bacterium]